MNLDNYTVDLAIQETAQRYLGGAGALGEAIGTNPRTFTNKCNPKMHHQLTLDECVAVMRVSKDHRILEALAEDLGYLCIRLETDQQLSDTDVLVSWADWYVELGELAGVVASALRDRKITLSEYYAVRAQMYDEFSRELHLLRTLDLHLLPIDCPLLHELHEKPVSESLKIAIDATVVNLGSLADTAKALGIQEGNLSRKLDDTDQGMVLNLREIHQLMLSSGDCRILFTLADQMDAACIGVQKQQPNMSDVELLNIWSACAKERGETAECIDDALNCDVPCREKIVQICKEMFDDFQHGAALLNRLAVLRVD